MATYEGQIPTTQTFAAPREPGRATTPATTVTTYYYRESGGTRGSATSLASVPAGAVIERTVTA